MARTVTIAYRTDTASTSGNATNLGYSLNPTVRMAANSPAAFFPLREYVGTSTLQAIPSTFNLTYAGPSGTRTLGADYASMSRYAQVVTSDSPVSYWRFNENGPSTSIRDTITTNTLTTTNVTTGQTGGMAPVNETWSAQFATATSTAVTSAFVAGLNPATVTLEAWVRADVVSGADRTIVATSTIGTRGAALKFDSATGKIAGGVGNATTMNWTLAPAAASPGVWYHVVFTSTASAQVLYVNGVQVATSSNTYSAGTAGAAGVGTQAGAALAGNVSDVAIYNVALNARQVYRHWQAGIGDRPAQQPFMPYAPNNITSEYAVPFDGTEQATCAYSATLNPSTLTVEGWVWTPPVGPSLAQTRHLVTSFSGLTNGYLVGLDTSNKLYAYTGTGATFTTLQGVTVLGPGWHHFALTVSGTAQTLWLDGNIETSATATYSVNSSANFAVGSGNNNTSITAAPHVGALSRVAVYNAALSADQIAERIAATWGGMSTPAHATLQVTAASGTSPTLTVTVQERGVDNVWYTVGTFAQATAASTQRVALSNLQGTGVFRAQSTVGGTTPSFTFTVQVTA